ncbi:MAG: hypothetical protein ABEJ56_05645 [Candidatus Nanohaloarchaea archaeon]
MTEYIVTGKFRALVEAGSKSEANRKLKTELMAFDAPEVLDMQRIPGVRVREADVEKKNDEVDE